MMLWAIAFDDVWDADPVHPSVLHEILNECRALASRQWRHAPVTHEVTRPLRWFREGLDARTLWQEVEPYWSREFLAFLQASRYEYDQTRGYAQLPLDKDPLVPYLSHACHSIALPWLLIAGLGNYDDRSVVAALSALSALAVQCGRVARLSNDLGTFGREQREGRVNAVTLLEADIAVHPNLDGPAMSESISRQATVAIKTRLDRELTRARNLAGGISTSTGVEERFLDVLVLGMTIYSHSDFRSLSQMAEN
jgi:hypothetical protein